MLFLIMKILTEKKILSYFDITHFSLAAIFYLDYHQRPHKVREAHNI